MLKRLKKAMCVILSLCLIGSTFVFAFADDEEENVVTPVIMVNDLKFNPLIDTQTEETAFCFADIEKQIPFTSGLPSAFYDELDMAQIEKLISGEMGLKDLMTFVLDALGYSEDISDISFKVVGIALDLVARLNIDITSGDIMKILSGLDVNTIAQFIYEKLTEQIEKFKAIELGKNENISILTLEGSFDDLWAMQKDEYGSELTFSIADKLGAENVYIFNYDFRLDPIENSGKLDEYIKSIKETTGSDKVKLVAEGYGSTIATTYLNEYKESALEDVENYVTIGSAFEGTTLAGNLFAGKVTSPKLSLDAKYVDTFFRYLNDMSDSPLTALATFVTTYAINKEVSVHKVNLLESANKLKKFIYNMFVKLHLQESAVSMPGLWALVPEDMFTDALDNIYGENAESEENAEFIQTLQNFKDIQYSASDILTDLADDGLKISVVASWDLQMLPLGNNMNMQSDGLVDTTRASFGATCVDLDDIVRAAKARQTNLDGHTHISTGYDKLDLTHRYAGICHYIDASTCALPENTWFVKGLKHGAGQRNSNYCDFINWLLSSGETARTVNDKLAYSQFMTYNRYVAPGVLSAAGLKKTADPRVGKYLRGDADLNETINISDVILAQQIANEMVELDEKSVSYINADAGNDTYVDEDDINWIMDVASGLNPNMTNGIDFDYRTEAGLLEDSPCKLVITPKFDTKKYTLTVEIDLTNASQARAGTFMFKYDEEELTFVKAETPTLTDSVVYREGKVESYDGTRAIAFSTADLLGEENVDENDILMLAKYTFTPNFDVKKASFSVGATKLYIDENDTFVKSTNSSVKIPDPPKPEPPKPKTLMGDWNNDGNINAEDARGILRIAARLEKCTDYAMFKRCDVDGDGQITSKDARQVLRVSARLQHGYIPAKTK